MAFTGTIKDEILEQEEIAFYLLKYLLNNHFELLVKKYRLDQEKIQDDLKQLDENQTIMNLMEQIGKNRGALVSGGKVDNKRVSNILLQDFREGRIGRITLEKCE